MMKCSTVLCFSGGLDSTVLLHHLLAQGEAVHCLSFSYGSRHGLAENTAARELCSRLGVTQHLVELSFISKLFSSSLLQSGPALPLGHYSEPSMKQTVVPGRNTIMGAIAIGYAASVGAEKVAIAGHFDDHGTYPDTRPEWLAAMQLVAYHGTYERISFTAPFTLWSKADICARGAELAVDFAKTWSCYAGGEIHCGQCGSCTSRKEAFAKANLKDPTSYIA